MELQLSNLTAAIMNSDLNLHKSGKKLFTVIIVISIICCRLCV